MLQRETLLHPMYAPASNDSTFMPCSLYSYSVRPCFWSRSLFPKSMLLFFVPLLPLLLLCIPLPPMFRLPMLQPFLCPSPFAPTPYVLAFDPAPYSSYSALMFLIPLLPMFLLRILLCSYVPASYPPMFLCSGFQCFNSLCPAPFAPTPYVLAFDTPPYSPNSMLLFLMPLRPMGFCFISFCILCLCFLCCLQLFRLLPPPIFSFLFATEPYAFDPWYLELKSRQGSS